MTGRGRGGASGRFRAIGLAAAAIGFALVPAEPIGLLIAALASATALVLAGFLRRPDRAENRSRANPLEDRLAEALEAAESARSGESRVGDPLRPLVPENLPRVRPAPSPNQRTMAGTGENLPEEAVAAAYEVLSAEIADRLEAFRRREGDLRRRETEIEAERKRIESFRSELARSIEQLRLHHERLEDIERELKARLRDAGNAADVERSRG